MSGPLPAAPDYAAMSPEQRIEALLALQQERCRIDAAQARLLAVIDPDPGAERDAGGELDKHWDREEVALVLHVSSQTTYAIMCEAAELVHRFPTTLRLLDQGAITMRHASRLVQACIAVPDAVAAKIEERVLWRASDQSLSQFGASLRRAVHALAPQQAEVAHANALAERRVAFTPRSDGTTELWALLPAPQAAAMQAAVRDVATRWKQHNSEDERSLDQRHADALAALVLGQPDIDNGARSDDLAAGDCPVSVKPVVQVTVALSTLLAVDEHPGELDGHGPIPASLARALAFDPHGTWRRLLTDANNNLVDVSVDTYRPPVPMARLVRAQHPTCCFPGCCRRARHAELDHITPWDGGPTTPSNLQPLCARHHHLKHEADWQVRRQPDGVTVWISPTGNTYRKPPDELPVDTTTNPPGPDAA